MTSTREWDTNLRTGLHPILHLLDDDRITNIQANGFNDIWVKGYGWKGSRRVSEVGWENFEHFKIGCIRVSQVINRPIHAGRPLLNGRLPGGERVNIAIPPACERIALTIRKFPAVPLRFPELEQNGSLSGDIRDLCSALVRLRRSILVSGGTDAGKTTLLNALTTSFEEHESVVTLEDARELRILQPNWRAMETVEPYEKDVQPVTMADLVRNVFRQNPDRIVVGEVRGEEAFYMLRTFSSGHRGGLSTVHANDAEDALHQVQLLAQMAPVAGLTAPTIASLVGRAVDVVIHQAFDEDAGHRRIMEIVELEPPGMRISPEGVIEYRFRRLVEWKRETGDWAFPCRPSGMSLAGVKRLGLRWPAASLTAPERGER